MFKSITKFARDSAAVTLRTQRISYVLSLYGMGGSLATLGLEISRRGIRFAQRSSGKPVPLDAVFGKNLAMTFARLGPTFIKLGQVLATRSDLVGDPIAEELKILFDRVPPVSFSEIKLILRQEWGKETLKKRFRHIEVKALASASLSQTHCATLDDGTEVIVKVQKRGVARTVEVDLILLDGLARSLDLVYPRFGIRQMFEDFKQSTLREVDYKEEAKNIERFQKNYRKIFSTADVSFPDYYRDLSTTRVLVLEPMKGKKLVELRKGSTVARKAATLSLEAILEQIFDHGFFHADPHGGNLFFQEDEGKVGFIDLGMVGQLDPKDKQRFLKVLLAILKRDRSKLARSLYELGEPSRKTDYKRFESEIHALLDNVKKQGVKGMRLDQLVNKVLGVARGNGIHVPNRYVLMMRSCLIIEGVAKGLDPSVSVFDIAKPIVARSLLKSYNPLNVFKRLF